MKTGPPPFRAGADAPNDVMNWLRSPLLIICAFAALACGAVWQGSVKSANNALLNEKIHVTLNDNILRENISFYSGSLNLNGSANYFLDFLDDGDRVGLVSFDIAPAKNAFVNLVFQEDGTDFTALRVSAFPAAPTGLVKFKDLKIVENAANPEWNAAPNALVHALLKIEGPKAIAEANGKAIGEASVEGPIETLRVASGHRDARFDNLRIEGTHADGRPFTIEEDFDLSRIRAGHNYARAFLWQLGWLAGAAALACLLMALSCRMPRVELAKLLASALAPGCLFLIPAQFSSAPSFLYAVATLSAAAVLFLKLYAAFAAQNVWFKRAAPGGAKKSLSVARPALAAAALLAAGAAFALLDKTMAGRPIMNLGALDKESAVFQQEPDQTLPPGAALAMADKNLFSQAIQFEFLAREDSMLDLHYQKTNLKEDENPHHEGLFLDARNRPAVLFTNVSNNLVDATPAANSQDALAIGEWNKVALIVSGQRADLWLNGRLVGEKRRRRPARHTGRTVLFAMETPLQIRNLRQYDLDALPQNSTAKTLAVAAPMLASSLFFAGLLIFLAAWLIRRLHFPGSPVEWKWGILTAGPAAAAALLLNASSIFPGEFAPDVAIIFAHFAAAAAGVLMYGLIRCSNGWGGKGRQLRSPVQNAALFLLLFEGVGLAAPVMANVYRHDWHRWLTREDIVWHFDPNVRYRNLFFKMQTLHSRPVTSNPVKRRVLLLGGSQTWGEGFPYNSDKDIASNLERMICSGSRACRWEVVNGGVLGANSHSELQFARALTRMSRPDIIVANFSTNEFRFWRGRQSDYKAYARPGPKFRISDYLTAAAAARALWLDYGIETTFVKRSYGVRLKTFRENVRSLKMLCAENGIKMALVDEQTLPNVQFALEAEIDGTKDYKKVAPFYDAMKEAASEPAWTIHLPTEEMTKKNMGNMLYFDSAHFTAIGNRVMANRMYEGIGQWIH